MLNLLYRIIPSIPLCFISLFLARANTIEPKSALDFQQSTNTRIAVEENHLRFFTGASERMTIDADGNVGVGTTSPANLLDVRLSSSGGWAMRIAEKNYGSGIILGVDPYGDDALSGYIAHTSSNRNLKYQVNGTGKHIFKTSGENSLIIDDGGNVGINSNYPESKLEILGDKGSVNDRNFRVRYFQLDNQWVGGAELSGIAHVEGNWTALYAKQGNAKSAAYFDGKVGIGTANPEAKFHVKEVVNLYSGKNVGSYTIGNTTGTLYEIAGTDSGGDNSNQSQGGYGLVRGANQISPVIWMYAFGGKNAFQVKRKGWNSTVQSGATLFHVETSGNVGIGTTSPSYKLHVNGDAKANRFISNTNTYADFVFEDDYKLAPLSEVEQYIENNHHLPDIPSEAEARKNGVDLQEMQTKLLQKIEELTLYVIELKKENESQSVLLSEQQKRLRKLENIEL